MPRPLRIEFPGAVYHVTSRGDARQAIVRRQTQAHRPRLRVFFQGRGEPARLIHTAYRQWDSRLHEIADHLGVHAATVSRRLKQADVRLQDLMK
jgi:hypothetical protein